MKNRLVKLLLVVIVLVVSIVWVGYSRDERAQMEGHLSAQRRVSSEVVYRRRSGALFRVSFGSGLGQAWRTAEPGKKGAGMDFTAYGLPWLVAPNITPDAESGARQMDG